MITFLFAWTGAAMGAMFMNYVLQGPRHPEDSPYRNSGHNAENYDD